MRHTCFADQNNWRSTYPYKAKKVPANPQKKEKTITNPKVESKPSTSKDNTVCDHDIQCFRCQDREHIARCYLNMQTLLLQEDREFDTDKASDEDSMPPLKMLKSLRFK